MAADIYKQNISPHWIKKTYYIYYDILNQNGKSAHCTDRKFVI